ncbi:MAG: Flp family type IVb pilin [Propionibacteriaceae bacterium]|nr:Flp family type IVb pilin [Propionibacteriaceae bacterium]
MLAAYCYVTAALHSVSRRFQDKEKGATAVEYALIIALIAVVIIGTVTALGGQINTAFQNVSKAVSGANASAPGAP